MSKAYRLLTLGPSHFCEKARWALGRARVPFVEEPHMPLTHALATFGAGAARTVPALVTDSGVLTDSSDILQLADRHCGGRLFGSGAMRKEATEIEEALDRRFGPDTRRAAYFYVIDRPELPGYFAKGVSLPERLAGRALFPFTRRLIKRNLRVNEDATRRSLSRIDAVFADMSARLEDGRKFLVGDQLTAADLTFASLAAPLILPAYYGGHLPLLDDVPDPFRELIFGYRATKAGQHVLKLYREQRHVVLEPADA